MAKTPNKKNDSAATIGFEAKLWLTADKLRNNMDAAEYKHVVLGLIFLKYISDSHPFGAREELRISSSRRHRKDAK
ncbi:type I restriction-modification system subunit M N-terminal domain-containing protein [Propionivibrio sp.]|uniref:type I restriction-modification system subunit M N-terminal domain-containing protein n=1 Tax=Propionivibrio sp. TaxID=2212460 RepID=UPI003BF45B1A